MRKFYLLLVVVLTSITAIQAQNNLVISQYIETSSGTTPKGIEIWNVSGGDIDFSATNLTIHQGTNGSASLSLLTTINSGTLASFESWVIGTSDIFGYLKTEGLDTINYTLFNFQFNGDDVIQIRLGGTIEDTFGNPSGSDPGTSWSGGGVSTVNRNIQLKSNIVSSDVDGWSDPSERFEDVADGLILTGFGIAPTPPCTSPTTAPSTLAFSNETVNSMDLTWTVGDGDSVLVVQKTGSAVDFTPSSGTSYNVGEEISGNTIVAKLLRSDISFPGTPVSITGLAENTTYHFAVYNFNTTDICYNATAATGSNATLDATAPVFENTTPSASDILDTQFTLTVDINEPDSVYYIIETIAGAITPDSLQVKAGNNGDGSAAFIVGEINILDETLAGTASITGLSAETGYRVYVVAEDASGNLSAVDSLDVTTETLTSTASLPSNISAAASISSIENDATITTDADGALVWSINLRDGDGADDTDTKPTIYEALNLTKGAANTVTDWSATILDAALFRGTTKIASGVISTDGIAFTLDVAESVADNDSTEVSLLISLNTTVTDGQAFDFALAASDISVSSAASSSQINSGATTFESGAVAIEVLATEFQVNSSSLGAAVGANFALTVEGVDGNGNLDNGATSSVTLSVNSGSGLLASTLGLTQNLVAGTFTWSDLTLDAAGIHTLTVSGDLTSANSGNVSVYSPGQLVVNEILDDPDTATGDANGDGAVSTANDEFVEIVNAGTEALDISGWVIADGFSDRHVFSDGTILQPGKAIVVFGGGTPTGTFGGSVVQTASTGGLGLNNGSDNVIVKVEGAEVTNVAYTGGGQNQSLARNPDVTGSLVLHSTISQTSPTNFSPGTRWNGTIFCFQPSVIPTDLIFANGLYDEIEVSWTNGNGDGRIVFARDSLPVEIGPTPGFDFPGDPVFSTATDLAGHKLVYNGTGNSFTLSGLTEGRTYHLAVYEYTAAERCYNDEALEDSFTLDITYPSFPVAPTLSDTTTSGVSLTVQLNELGTVYYAVVPDNSLLNPTSEQVKAGVGFITAGSIVVDEVNTDKVAVITGLDSDTMYDVLVVGEDNASPSRNIMLDSDIAFLDLTTLATDTQWPQLIKIAAENITDVSFDFVVQLNEPGTVYYAIMPDESSTPSVEDVKAGTVTGALTFGSLPIDSAAVDRLVNITGLTEGTAYDVFIVAEDDEPTPNVLDFVELLNVSTVDLDLEAPVFTSTYPKVTNITYESAQLDIQVDEAGTAYYVVLADGATAPSVAQIMAGTDATDNPAIIFGDSVIEANTELNIELLGLTYNSSYDIFVVVQDDESTPNVQSSGTLAEFATSGPATIQSIRDDVNANGTPNSPGATVFVQGVIHGVNVNPGTPNRFQFALIDNSGAITIRSGGSLDFGLTDLAEGDEVTVEGTLGHFNGLMQIEVTSISRLSTGNARVAPIDVTTFDEVSESQLVRVSDVSIANTAEWTGSAANTGSFNVNITVNGVTQVMRIDRNTPLAKLTYAEVFGTATSGISITGLGGQFDNADPRDTGYQFLPYSAADISLPADLTAPVFSSTPVVANINSTGADLTVNINEAGTVYYVVLADGATAPSAAQVKAGTDAANAAATLAGNNVVEAATDFVFALSGLSSGTAYDVYVVAQDDETSPNVQASATLVEFSTDAVDNTAPVFSATYPSVSGITTAAATLAVSLDEIGTAYYVVVADGATAPSVAQIQAGTDAADAAALLAGTINVSTADTEFTASLSGLSELTSYDVYVVAEDNEATANVQATATLVEFTTLEPGQGCISDLMITEYVEGSSNNKFIEIYNGTGASIDLTGYKLSLYANGATTPGNTFVLVDSLASLADGEAIIVANSSATAITVPANAFKFNSTVTFFNGNDVVALLKNDVIIDQVGTLGGSTDFATNIGLRRKAEIINPNSSYVATEWDSVAIDTFDELGVHTFVCTGDVTAPEFTASYPAISNINSTGADLTVNINEAGKVYYVVLADGATAPSAAQVKAGTDAADAAATLAANSVVALNTDFVFNLTSLANATAYDVYVVAEDDEATPNVQASPVLVEFTTDAEDLTAPVFATGSPAISNVTTNSATLSATIDETGTVYYVMLADGATAPSVAQVLAGTDASDATVSASGNLTVSTANEAVTASLSGLSAATGYDVYVVAADNEATPNVQAELTLVEFTTSEQGAGCISDLMFTEYVEGTSNNKFIEIYNGTGATIDLTGYKAVLFANGATTPGNTFILVDSLASLADGESIIIANSAAAAVTLPSGAYKFTSSVTFFNGNDVVELMKDDVTIDALGVRGVSTDFAANVTLRRNQVVLSGNPTYTASEWEVLAVDTFDGLGAHIFTCDGDQAAPVFTTGYPLVQNISSTGADVVVNMDEAGTVFYVVLPDTLAAPSVAQVLAGTNASDVAALAAGTIAVTATTDSLASVAGLNFATNYVIYLVAQDDESTPNVQASVSTLAFTTDVEDITAPVFAATYPLVREITPSAATLAAQMDEPGTVFYVVLADGATAPSVAQVMAGTDAADAANAFAGNIAMTTADTEFTAAISGLTLLTAYDVYVVAQDNEATPNVQAAVTKIDFTTTGAQAIADVRAQVDANGNPTVTGPVTVQGIVHGANINPGTDRFQYSLIDDSGAITIRSGTSTPVLGFELVEGDEILIQGNVSSFNGLMQIEPTSVTRSSQGNARVTPTVVTVLNEDSESALVTLENVSIADPSTWTGAAANTASFNVTVSVGGVDMTVRIDRNTELAKLTYAEVFGTATSGISITGLGGQFDNADPRDSGYQLLPYLASDIVAAEDLTAPVFTTGYPQMANIVDVTADLRVNMDEPGKAYYVVLADGATAPSVAEVKAGQQAGGTAATISGQITVTAANADFTAILSGLTAETAYDVYVVAEDNQATPNVQAAVTLVEFTTEAEIVVPEFAFTSASTTLAEAGGVVNVTIQLTNPATTTSLVEVVVSGTAVLDEDYEFTNPVLVELGAGETEATLTFTILNDEDVEEDETIILTLQNVTNAVLGTAITHTITITNDDEEVVDPINGVGPLLQVSKFKVYPNPSASYITLEQENGAFNVVEIINTLGEVVLSQQSEQVVSQTRLDVQGLKNGMYLIRVVNTHSDEQIVLRMMKE